MNRRDFLKRSALAGAGLAVGSRLRVPGHGNRGVLNVANASGTTCDTTPLVGCKWGIFPMPRGGQNWQTALTDLEAAVGRQFAVHRNYQGMDSDIIGKVETFLTARGTIPYRTFHSWRNPGKTAIPWKDVAAGKMDAWLLKQATDIKAFGQPLYLSFHHEPENDVNGSPSGQAHCGTVDEYRAAHNHVRSVFDSVGTPNVKWALTLMASTYRGQHGGPQNFEPDSYDLVGVDGYNRYPCKGSAPKSFADIFSAAHDFAVQRGKKMAIGEYASVEFNSCGKGSGDPMGKALWITDAGNTIKAWPEVEFAVYTHEVDPGLSYWVDTSAASLAAFKSVGLDTYFTV